MLAFRRLALRRRVLVNFKSGKAVEGILTRKAGPLLEIRQAQLHEAGRPPVPMDGTVLIERSNVDFMQVVGEV